MRPEDLMIGDWVRCPGLPQYGEFFQVADITPCICIDAERELFANPEDLEPIPLTEEILEKNGFKFDGSGQCSMMFLSEPQFAEGLRFNIYVGLKRKSIEVFAAHPIEKSPNWRKSNKVYLEVCGCYVHELQHALRLCGIEKEITL